MKNVSHLRSAAGLKVSKTGLKAFRKVGAFIKPTTRMIQYFGNTATKARVEIDEGQLFKLLAGEEIPVDLDLEDGYVILALSMNRVLGFGFIYKGKVRSKLPRKELRHAMVQLSPTQY